MVVRFLLCALLLASVSLAAGCSLRAGRESVGPALVEPTQVKADIVTAERGVLTLDMRGVGVVVPTRTEYLHFTIDGKLGEAAVRQGDRVKKGDVIFRLDPGNAELELLQQQLTVENMKATLADSQESGGSGGAQIDRMNVAIEQKKLERMQELRDKRVLVAPYDGIVSFVDDVRVGGPIAAYRDVVGIADPSRLQLSFIGDFSAYASRMSIGMPVELQFGGAAFIGSLAVAPWTAPIDEFPERADVMNRTLLFDLADPVPAGLSIGDYVDFTLTFVRIPDALLLPRGAVRHYQSRDYVLLVDGETRREADVQLGLATRTELEIVSGLREGQQVIVN